MSHKNFHIVYGHMTQLEINCNCPRTPLQVTANEISPRTEFGDLRISPRESSEPVLNLFTHLFKPGFRDLTDKANPIMILLFVGISRCRI